MTVVPRRALDVISRRSIAERARVSLGWLDRLERGGPRVCGIALPLADRQGPGGAYFLSVASPSRLVSRIAIALPGSIGAIAFAARLLGRACRAALEVSTEVPP